MLLRCSAVFLEFDTILARDYLIHYGEEMAAMPDKIDVTFSMTARDLSFLAYALEFISGGIDDKDETIRNAIGQTR
jgi:hypothetical protein